MPIQGLSPGLHTLVIEVRDAYGNLRWQSDFTKNKGLQKTANLLAVREGFEPPQVLSQSAKPNKLRISGQPKLHSVCHIIPTPRQEGMSANFNTSHYYHKEPIHLSIIYNAKILQNH